MVVYVHRSSLVLVTACRLLTFSEAGAGRELERALAAGDDEAAMSRVMAAAGNDPARMHQAVAFVCDFVVGLQLCWPSGLLPPGLTPAAMPSSSLSVSSSTDGDLLASEASHPLAQAQAFDFGMPARVLFGCKLLARLEQQWGGQCGQRSAAAAGSTAAGAPGTVAAPALVGTSAGGAPANVSAAAPGMHDGGHLFLQGHVDLLRWS